MQKENKDVMPYSLQNNSYSKYNSRRSKNNSRFSNVLDYDCSQSSTATHLFCEESDKEFIVLDMEPFSESSSLSLLAKWKKLLLTDETTKIRALLKK